MKVSAWLLYASWLYSWAEFTQRCKCQDLCPTELEVKKSKTRVKVHFRNPLGHKHTPLRSRPHHRKGARVCARDVPPRIVHQPSDVVVKLGKPATFSCRGDGNPKPTIEWLHNGQPLEVTKGNGQLQPMVLSDDRLFFLSVSGSGRGQSHEGIYTCVARNSAGTAISHNASLHIAALQEAFTVEPSDVEVAEGEVAVLNCAPPLGYPEPNIMWRKDGLPINYTDFHYTELNGKLIIAPAEKNHSGAYVCVASNTMGVRESRAARFTVLAKPVLVLKPENVSVRLGESAQFNCQAKGDPPPAVVWSREQGPLPNGRYLMNPDQTLQIHYVTAQDAGQYTCTAVNDVGMVTATAQLLVEASSTKQKDLHIELSALRLALENVTIMAPGSNISEVQWKLQSLPIQPHYLDGFEVLYRSLLPASSDWAAKKVTVPSFQTQVGPLKRGYKYEFKVRPYGSSLYGRESNTRLLRVPETVPSAAPLAVSITVNHDHNNSIHLNWEPPPSETHNGIIQGYQVWCVESYEQQYQNWTVDSKQHWLDIFALQPGKRYWITLAAVNGAGVGVPSDPHGFVINPQIRFTSESERHRPEQSTLLTLLQDPVLIGSIGALMWCILMVAAVCLLRRHSKIGHLIPGRDGAKGLRRRASEDIFINHRMTAPDSPWVSGSCRPAFNKHYQDLWVQGHKPSGMRNSNFQVPTKKDPSCEDSAVPIVTDSCAVYGTFYVDLMGNGLKTFKSPRRYPKMPHGLPQQQGFETIQIFPQPKTSPLTSSEMLPWKQSIRPQPKMGVLRESWEKSHIKQEVHAVNSVPIVQIRNQAAPSHFTKQRFSHIPSSQLEYNQFADCPRLLHNSASLQLIDVLPPLFNLEEATDSHSVTSDEGSSRSTKLTMDLGSLQSVCDTSDDNLQPGSSNNNTNYPSSSPLSTVLSSRSLDEEQDDTLTAKEASRYLELNSKIRKSSRALPEQHSSCLHPLTTSMGYNSEHIPSAEMAPDTSSEALPIEMHHSRLQSSPSSCYSEWDSSLWNTWSSITDEHFASARTSLISSVDSCYTNASSNFAHFLTAESVSGASLSDFSPPASPLSALYPSFSAEGNTLIEMDPVPAWDWSMSWMEEMEAQYRAYYPGRNAKPFNT